MLWYGYGNICFFTEDQTEIAHNQNLILSSSNKGLVIWKRWKQEVGRIRSQNQEQPTKWEKKNS